MFSSPQKLALTLKELIAARGLKQKALAAQVGLTESSLSMILNAKARPRQLTLSRLLQYLDCTPDEQQRVLTAYDHSEHAELPLRPGIREVPTPKEEIQRIERYLAVKSESVLFEQAVEKILLSQEIRHEHPYLQDPLICDFLLPGPPRTIIECKCNTRRDWDRTIVTAKMLKERIPCDRVIIVVPTEDEFVKGAREEIDSESIKVVTLNSLEDVL